MVLDLAVDRSLFIESDCHQPNGDVAMFSTSVYSAALPHPG